MSGSATTPQPQEPTPSESVPPIEGCGLPPSGTTCTVLGPGVDELRGRFKWLPEMAEWEPGDLVLFRPRARDPKDRAGKSIVSVQRLQYAPAHARWTHAAVYAGGGELIEATLGEFAAGGGVRRYGMSAHLPGHILELRRDLTLTPAQRVGVVEEADALVGEDYSVPRAVEIARAHVAEVIRRHAPERRARGRGRLSIRRRPVVSRQDLRGYVCSDVYALAYEAVTRRRLGDNASLTCPAFLSAHPAFAAVAVRWCTIS